LIGIWESRVGPFGAEETRTRHTRADDDEYRDGPGPWCGSTDEGDEEEVEDELDNYDNE